EIQLCPRRTSGGVSLLWRFDDARKRIHVIYDTRLCGEDHKHPSIPAEPVITCAVHRYKNSLFVCRLLALAPCLRTRVGMTWFTHGKRIVYATILFSWSNFRDHPLFSPRHTDLTFNPHPKP
ncbi:unnamed protein product, partial [Ectocarpus sp. 4 AP-2014]